MYVMWRPTWSKARCAQEIQTEPENDGIERNVLKIEVGPHLHAPTTQALKKELPTPVGLGRRLAGAQKIRRLYAGFV